MLVLEAVLFLASLAVAAALVSRVWTWRRGDGVPDPDSAGDFDPARARRDAQEDAAALSVADQLWLELEAQMERKPLRYPYKG